MVNDLTPGSIASSNSMSKNDKVGKGKQQKKKSKLEKIRELEASQQEPKEANKRLQAQLLEQQQVINSFHDQPKTSALIKSKSEKSVVGNVGKKNEAQLEALRALTYAAVKQRESIAAHQEHIKKSEKQLEAKNKEVGFLQAMLTKTEDEVLDLEAQLEANKSVTDGLRMNLLKAEQRINSLEGGLHVERMKTIRLTHELLRVKRENKAPIDDMHVSIDNLRESVQDNCLTGESDGEWDAFAKHKTIGATISYETQRGYKDYNCDRPSEDKGGCPGEISGLEQAKLLEAVANRKRPDQEFGGREGDDNSRPMGWRRYSLARLSNRSLSVRSLSDPTCSDTKSTTESSTNDDLGSDSSNEEGKIAQLEKNCKANEELINQLRSKIVRLSSCYKEEAYVNRMKIQKLFQENKALKSDMREKELGRASPQTSAVDHIIETEDYRDSEALQKTNTTEPDRPTTKGRDPLVVKCQQDHPLTREWTYTQTVTTE